MGTDLDNSTISTPAELAELAARFVDQFCSQMAFPSAMDIHIDRHPHDHINRSPQPSPLYTTLQHRKLTIHLNEKDLMGLSPLALQGWLGMELARCQLALEPLLYRINFNNDIRPLFSTAGSGTHLVRHIVAHLETGLKNLIAAQIVIDMGNGTPLLYYYTYKISPSIEEKQNYQRLFPHHWIRAIFLCKKNKGFAPVALMADKGIAAELVENWWKCHAYMTSEDKYFLETLFHLSNQNPVKHFSETVVEMFKLVKSQLLLQ